MHIMGWLTDILPDFELTWSGVLGGLVLYLVTFMASTVVGAWLLIKLPATYFCDASPRGFWDERHPVLRWLGLLLQNLLAGLLVALGGILALPGIPGPG